MEDNGKLLKETLTSAPIDLDQKIEKYIYKEDVNLELPT
jgi:hypothetical protein